MLVLWTTIGDAFQSVTRIWASIVVCVCLMIRCRGHAHSKISLVHGIGVINAERPKRLENDTLEFTNPHSKRAPVAQLTAFIRPHKQSLYLIILLQHSDTNAVLTAVKYTCMGVYSVISVHSEFFDIMPEISHAQMPPLMCRFLQIGRCVRVRVYTNYESCLYLLGCHSRRFEDVNDAIR